MSAEMNISNFIEQVLNLSLSGDESTIKQSFKIDCKKTGFLFTPRMPSGLIMNDELYYRIYDIVSFAIYPKFTLIRPNGMQVVTHPSHSLATARSFFFPWKIGVSKRLVGPIDQIIRADSNRIRIMDGLDYDFNKAVGTCLSGNTGAGKSFAMRYLLENYYRLGQVILIDPKKSDGARWAKGHPKTRLIIPNEDDRPEDFLPRVNAILAEAIRELYRRQTNLYEVTKKISTDYRELSVEPIFIVIDEVASLAVGLKKNLLSDFHSLLTQISLLGREAGVFLCLSLQEARADLLPVAIRSQMGVRILLGRVDKNSAQFLFPELDQGFALPIGGKGTGIISINDGEHFGVEPVAMPTIQDEV